MRQYGLYSAVRELQSKWGFIYFDGDDIAASFQKTKRDVVYDDCKALISAGWFEIKSERNRKKDGTWEARKIVAITHREWSAKYPNNCNLKAQPVAPHQLDEAPDQSLQSDQPVAPQQPTSRPTAIDQSLPSDKDLVQSRQGSTQTSFKAEEPADFVCRIEEETPTTIPDTKRGIVIPATPPTEPKYTGRMDKCLPRNSEPPCPVCGETSGYARPVIDRRAAYRCKACLEIVELTMECLYCDTPVPYAEQGGRLCKVCREERAPKPMTIEA
jgi:hypothetical protein